MISSKSYRLEEHQIQPLSEDVQALQKSRVKDKKDGGPASQFSVKIKNMDEKELEIDMIGLHFSLANAYRRIVLAEVATVAIEKVYMYNNTSVVQDEVLSHRLGLVPLNVPPQFFNFANTKISDPENFTEANCVKYKLRVKCRGKKDSRQVAKDDDDDVDTSLIDRLVTTRDLQWVPIGNQGTLFASNPLTPIHEEPIDLPARVKPVNTDLVLAKLNPGQKIMLEAYAFKGIGSDHAKFQPGLCWYRMLPCLSLTRPVLGDEARQLQKCFSKGVIDVVKNSKGVDEAVVVDARDDSCSRNVYNYDNLKDAVKMTRDAQHIIFHVESHSAMKSYEILDAAVDVLIGKLDVLLEQLVKAEEE